MGYSGAKLMCAVVAVISGSVTLFIVLCSLYARRGMWVELPYMILRGCLPKCAEAFIASLVALVVIIICERSGRRARERLMKLADQSPVTLEQFASVINGCVKKSCWQHDIVCRLLKNPSTPPEILEYVALRLDVSDRFWDLIADHPNTPAKVIRWSKEAASKRHTLDTGHHVG